MVKNAAASSQALALLCHQDSARLKFRDWCTMQKEDPWRRRAEYQGVEAFSSL